MKTMLALALMVLLAGAVPVYATGDRRDEPQAPRSADVQVLVRADAPQAP